VISSTLVLKVLGMESSIILSVHPAVNGYLTVFRAGKVNVLRKKSGLGDTVAVGSLTATSPTALRAMGTTLTFV